MCLEHFIYSKLCISPMYMKGKGQELIHHELWEKAVTWWTFLFGLESITGQNVFYHKVALTLCSYRLSTHSGLNTHTHRHTH